MKTPFSFKAIASSQGSFLKNDPAFWETRHSRPFQWALLYQMGVKPTWSDMSNLEVYEYSGILQGISLFVSTAGYTLQVPVTNCVLDDAHVMIRSDLYRDRAIPTRSPKLRRDKQIDSVVILKYAHDQLVPA